MQDLDTPHTVSPTPKRDVPDAHFDALLSAFEHACAVQAQGRPAQARAAFEALLQAAPPGHAVCAPAWANLGLALDELALKEADREAMHQAARQAFERAIALDASLYAPQLHLGQWWMNRPEPDATARSEHWLQQAARLRPQDPGVWSALGGLLTCLRRDADAQACLRHALQLAPQHIGARFNLSYLCLRQGRWAEGWACLEMRPLARTLAASLPWPRWAGEPLAGRRLLIVNDAGHGDLIQFWRWRQRLHDLGACEVAWMVQPALIALLQAQPDVGPVWALDGEVPLTGPAAPDAWAPLLSLPWLCDDDGDWPDALPYLQAPKATSSSPRPFTIGLVWHGNPSHENDAERSLPSVASLAPVVEAAQAWGARVVNLQPAPLDDGPGAVPHLTSAAPLHGFDQVAQALQHIDLLITVDTAYAHLAGALGRPVWVMLPNWKTDWRWLEGRSDSPWYPGVMRLFRQRTRGDWAGVVAEVATEVGAKLRHTLNTCTT